MTQVAFESFTEEGINPGFVTLRQQEMETDIESARVREFECLFSRRSLLLLGASTGPVFGARCAEFSFLANSPGALEV